MQTSDPDLKETPVVVLCRCGCGTALPAANGHGRPSTYVHGHNRRNSNTPLEKRRIRKAAPSRRPEGPLVVPCACGCGTMLPERNVRGRPSRYARGHQNRGKTPSAESKARQRAGLKRTYDRKGRKSPTWHRHLDPRYREWRLAVFERDSYTCQQCGHVGRADEKGFAAHHILPYATHPEARYDLANGQTLCRLCHSRLHGIALKPRTMRRCACGCGTLIPSVDRYGAERRYVNGHYWRGRKRSPEQYKAMSEARKGKKHSAEARAKMSATRKGKPLSPQLVAAAAAACAARKGQKRPDLAERNKQRVWTDESRQKLSQSRKGTIPSPVARAKMSAAGKGKPKSPEHRAALTEARRRRAERERSVKTPD